MKVIMTVLLSLCLLLTSEASRAGDIKMAVTTSFQNSGLAEHLLPEILNDTGVTVHLVVVGTGQALALGRNGDVDAILVHSRPDEEAFVRDGYAPYRREIMYNDFILVGPESDPAHLAQAKTASEAFLAMSKAGIPFMSRGDDSGTHKRELSLWQKAGLDPSAFDPSWYHEAGAGMGATLNTASAMDAYVLSDRGSWLNFGNPGTLALLFSGDPDLLNHYAFLPLSSKVHSHVNAADTEKLEAWLVSKKGQAMIGDYKINGEQLFTPSADQTDQ